MMQVIVGKYLVVFVFSSCLILAIDSMRRNRWPEGMFWILVATIPALVAIGQAQ